MIRNARATPATEADAGKFAVRDTVFRDGFCSRPIQITKVSKTRAYFKDTTRHWVDLDKLESVFEVDDREEFCKADSLRYICDTLEEATKLHKLSDEQQKALRESDRAIREKYNKYVNSLLT